MFISLHHPVSDMSIPAPAPAGMGLVKATTIVISASNISNLGSDLEKKVKKAAAESEEQWKGAGTKEGLLIWRIEKFKVDFEKKHKKKRKTNVSPYLHTVHGHRLCHGPRTSMGPSSPATRTLFCTLIARTK